MKAEPPNAAAGSAARSPRLTIDDVRLARQRIAPLLPPTPLRPSLAVPGLDLRLKLECWQPTGSFKVRGALNLLASLTPGERSRPLLAASAGNHALGVAYAAERLGGGLRPTLFVPLSAPAAKVERLRRFPVELRQVGASYDETALLVEELRAASGATLLHAFEDPRTAAGQGTLALEILEQCPDLASVLVPVGGGGLLAGVGTALRALAPAVRIVAVQAAASPALSESLRRGEPLTRYPAAPTLADGLAGGIGEIAFAHRDLIDELLLVSEPEIEAAIVELLAADHVVAEGAAAVGVAAVLAGRLKGSGRGPTVAIVSGGNIDSAVLARLLALRYGHHPP